MRFTESLEHKSFTSTLPVERDEVVMRFVEAIGKKHGIPARQLLHNPERYPRLIEAKHELWTITRWTLGLSYPETARFFGLLDHTTIIHAEKNYLWIRTGRSGLSPSMHKIQRRKKETV